MNKFLFGLVFNLLFLGPVKGLDIVRINNKQSIDREYVKGTWQSSSSDQKPMKIFIKKRGNSSLHFKKGQYQVRFFKSHSGRDEKISHGPLGLPTGRKWVLYGPYVDRSLLRNALAYQIGQRMRPHEWWAPRFKFFELVLNNQYEGIYLLTEKIERDDNRLFLERNDFKRGNRKGPSYILHLSGSGGAHHFKTGRGTKIKWRYPSEGRLQKESIRNSSQVDFFKKSVFGQINALEDALKKIGKDSGGERYRSFIDIPSFVDFILVQEFFKNVDGYRRSGFFYKSSGEKIKMGPLWDFNLAGGNYRYFKMWKTKGWLFKYKVPFAKNAFWFKKLLKDPYFLSILKKRYFDLRRPGRPFSDGYIKKTIRGLKRNLGPQAMARNEKRWKKIRHIIHGRVFNTRPKQKTVLAHINHLESFLLKRGKWMDEKIMELSYSR